MSVLLARCCLSSHIADGCIDPYNTPPGSQAGAGSSLLSQEIAEIASPHAERSAQSPPRYFRRWLDVWNFFREKYERDLPSNDARFIRTYLTQHRQETASFLQNTILEHCNTAQPRQNEPHGRHGIKLFVHLRTFAWQDVLDAFEHINYPELHRVLQIDEHRRQRRVVGPAMVPLEGITCSRNNQWAGTGDAEI